jgi:DNA repair protein RadC
LNSGDSYYCLGHREILREKFLEHKCVDYEILELLLTYAIPRQDASPIAKNLLMTFGGVHKVITAPSKELVKLPGIGKSTAIFIKAIYEIMLLDYKNYLNNSPVFHDYQKLADYCKLLLSGKKVEELHVLFLDSDYRLLSDDLHSSGTINWAAVYPREILKRALNLNSCFAVMLHNHLGGAASFSSEDIRITLDVKKLLKNVDIELFDHLLVSGDMVYSARNMFLLN